MKFPLTILLAFFLSCSYSQNLVPNPSFENYSFCPDDQGQIFYAIPWFNPDSSNFATPDYYHQCSNAVGVPYSPIALYGLGGFQYAKTGISFAGIFVYEPTGITDGREYIECELTEPLTAGKKYCIAFYVSLGNYCRFSVDVIGAYFSENKVLSDYLVLPFQPQVSNPAGNFLSDTANWMLISGEFVANGGEKFLTIGNFRNDSTTNVDTMMSAGGDYSYYYIDDVSLYEIDESMLANLAGADTTLCLGDSIIIGTPAISGYSYVWQLTTGLNDTANPQPIVFPQVTTTFYLTVKDSTTGSCQYPVKDSVTVFVLSPPTANAGNDKMFCDGESATLGTTGMNGYNYQWYPVTGLNDALIAQPNASPTRTTMYVLTVNDTGNICSPSTDSVTVSIENCDTAQNNIFLPSIFSPNGDGNNDVLRVRGANISEINFIIYNRWGEKVFETTDKMKGWDGSQNGKPLNTGVFVYFLKVSYEDGNTEQLKGNVTLLK